MITKKIILGSANVNSLYGLRNNRISTNEFKSLLSYAYKKGVKTLDTSPVYKNSEKIIGLSKNKFNVITKIPKIPKNLKKNKIESWIRKKIINSKKKIENKFHGILLQNAEILLSNKAKIIFETLTKLKKEGNFKKIGISIYNFKTLELVLKKFNIDFVQLPYNILDQRFANKKVVNIIKKKSIEIHARSIFLQGLLTEKEINLPKKLNKLKSALIKWKKWIQKEKVSPVSACLEFVIKNKNIDKLVIGFNSKNNFKDVIKFKKTNIKFNNFNIKINQNLLDPRKW